MLREIARPIILVAPDCLACPAWSASGSLSNRSLAIELAPLAVERSEAALSRDFDALRAPVLAALADAVSSALAHVRDVELPQVPRFPDSVAWAVAAAPVLGLDSTAVVEAVSDPESMWLASQNSRPKTQKHV